LTSFTPWAPSSQRELEDAYEHKRTSRKGGAKIVVPVPYGGRRGERYALMVAKLKRGKQND